MADSFTEVTRRGFGGNVKRRGKGAIVGVILFLVAFPLLWWNEGRLATVHAGLTELTGTLTEISPQAVDPLGQGQPVYLAGQSAANAVLQDDIFGISVSQSLRLRRTAEMYQWEERKEERTRDTPGGGSETVTTYHYDEVWSQEPINSSNFRQQGYDNPAMPFQSRVQNAPDAALGAFRLSDEILAKVNTFQPLPLPASGYIPPAGFEAVDANTLYRGSGTQSAPEIGDMRVSFQAVGLEQLSIIGQQRDDTITPHVTSNGTRFLLVGTGIQPPEALVQTRRDQEELMAWVLRGVGYVMLLIGVQGVFQFIGALGGFIPFLRGIAGGVGFVVGLMVSATLGTLTIALAWVVYRPLIGAALLGVALLTLIAGIMLARKDPKIAATKAQMASG